MTCIVGLVHDGDVYIGADSASTSGWDLTIRADEKVFARGPFLCGFTTSYRMGQLLRYSLNVPEHPEGMGTDEFMVTVFIDAVRTCLKTGGFTKIDNSVEVGGEFLVGYMGCLYVVHSDFSVCRSADDFVSVGCGEQIANGAMYALRDCADPSHRVFVALEAAERLSAGVRGPFIVLSSNGARIGS